MRSEEEIMLAAAMLARIHKMFSDDNDDERRPLAAASLDLAAWILGWDNKFDKMVMQPIRNNAVLMSAVKQDLADIKAGLARGDKPGAVDDVPGIELQVVQGVEFNKLWKNK
jgi:hypothetical protein